MKNKEYQMIIRVTDMDLVQALLTKAERMGLTISNDGETKTGIEHIQLGNSISVGTSDKFCVNWAKNIDYYAKRGIVPVYDISLDWTKIVARLESYANWYNAMSTVTDNEYSLSDGGVAIVDHDSDTVVINDDVTLDKQDLETLRKISALNIDLVYDNDTDTFEINGSPVTVTELHEIREMMEEV